MHVLETETVFFSQVSQESKECLSDTETKVVDIPRPAEGRQQVIARLKDDELLSVTCERRRGMSKA